MISNVPAERIYADSSFIVSFFAADANSEAARRCIRRYSQSIPFNPLHRLETRNAIRLAARRGKMDSDACKTALMDVEAGLRDGVLVHMPVNWTDALRRAEALSARHTETLGCRSADILHVAFALESGARIFLSFDAVQRQLARAEGLKVLP